MVRLKGSLNASELQNLKFQFQYGSIKRGNTNLVSLPSSYFNSNMVRLKDSMAMTSRLIHSIFQFQYGSIKSLTTTLSKLAFLHFNSNMVRLKEIRSREVRCRSAISIPIWFD